MFKLTSFQFASAYYAGVTASKFSTVNHALNSGRYDYWLSKAGVNSAFLKGMRDGLLGC